MEVLGKETITKVKYVIEFTKEELEVLTVALGHSNATDRAHNFKAIYNRDLDDNVNSPRDLFEKLERLINDRRA